MKFSNASDVNDFIAAVDSCKGEVYLTSAFGDKYNLKSKFSQFIGIGELLKEHGDELELFCDEKEDERKLINFLVDHKNVEC